jgi:hypothetical protein
MPRNNNAGKHPSYLRLNWSPSSIKRKKEYDKKYSSSEKQKKYRVELNRANREAGTYGNGDNKDMSHTKSGKLKMEHQRLNRARNGRNGKSTKK